MTRIEQVPSSVPRSSHRSIFTYIWKAIKVVVGIPFKITFRLLIVLMILFIGVQLIRMGVLQVPYISDILYQTPHPVRNVEAATVTGDLLLSRAKEILKTTGTSQPTMRFKENEMTALFQQSLEKVADKPFQNVQLAVLDGEVEFFGNLRSNTNIYVTAKLEPKASNGRIESNIKKVIIGDVRVPQVLVSSKAMEFIASQTFTLSLPPIGCSSIQLHETYLDCSLTPVK